MQTYSSFFAIFANYFVLLASPTYLFLKRINIHAAVLRLIGELFWRNLTYKRCAWSQPKWITGDVIKKRIWLIQKTSIFQAGSLANMNMNELCCKILKIQWIFQQSRTTNVAEITSNMICVLFL